MKIILIAIYLSIYALSTLRIFESKGILSFGILYENSWIFLAISFIFSFFIFLKGKYYKNKLLFNLIVFASIGSFINFFNVLVNNSTPFYYSICSLFAFALGLKYTNNKESAEYIEKGFLIFGLINLITSINQILVAFNVFDQNLLIYAVGNGPVDSPYAYILRPVGLFNNPFSLAVLGTLLIAIPARNNIYLYRTVGALLVFVSISRAYIVFTFCHLIFWALRKTTIKIFKKSSTFLNLSIIIIVQLCLGLIYLDKLPSSSFQYKFDAIPKIFNVFIENPLSILFGFTKANENQFLESLNPNLILETPSYESWYLRLIIFGGIFLALVYFYPLIKIHLLSLKYNKQMIFNTSSLICTSLASMVSNGGFGGPNSFVYFYIIAYIYTENKKFILDYFKNTKKIK